MPQLNGLCPDMQRKLQPTHYGKLLVWDGHFDGHGAAAMARVREAVKYHALRLPRTGVPCEACFTVIVTGACSVCLHLYASIPPLGLMEDDRPDEVGNVEAEVPAGVWQLIEQAVAAVPDHQPAALPQAGSTHVGLTGTAAGR